MKILVADDSKTNLNLITSILEKLEHIVTAVASGHEAIESFNKNPPDLIILDVVMEDMNGFETAKRMRQLKSEDWIPIIFLSANVDEESIRQGIDAGGDDYLTKPISEITLIAKIKAMQRISDMRQALIRTTKKLERLSATDALTGIYNRFHFDQIIIEKLAAAERHHKLMALMFIDLDNFKLINDTFGHHIGDLLLKEVASRLKSTLRIEDTVARIGGDEFSIILTDLESVESTSIIAQKVLDTLNVDFYLEGHNIRIGASIGIACFPYPETTKENFLKHADVAMYHAKSLGRNNYQYYSKDLNERYRQLINLEYALRFALERKEISLSYQPVFNLEQNIIVGLEALVSWHHPTFGNVSPNIFIPIAEETGLITSIGNWVLREACQQAKILELKKYNNFKLAINLSSHQLLQENFYEMIIDILNDTRIPPNLIELELTETTVMSYRTNHFKDIISKLQSIGMSIAIDDFGTGYSSLTRLKHLSINTLKIDKSFIQDSVTDPNSEIIVSCLIALGKNLGLKVIAEGIETEKQLQLLKSKDCLFGQGFLLSRPLSSDKLEQLLKTIEINTTR